MTSPMFGGMFDSFDLSARASMDEARKVLEAANVELVAEALRQVDRSCTCGDDRYRGLAKVAIDTWRRVAIGRTDK